MLKKLKLRKIKFLCVLPCFFIFSSVVLTVKNSSFKDGLSPVFGSQGRHLLQSNGSTPEECIPSGIHSFPEDFFSQEERQRGGVLVHFLILFYACAVIALVCDGYFIPSLEVISDKLNLPPDVAGATFMAVGASSPELFSSIIGSFVTEGDIGIGAVIGSAVFNILGITGVAGIALWNEVLDIDWYPMVRDCIAYTVTVLCLVSIIFDGIVTWWESVILLGIFLLYIVLMYFNRRVEKCTRALALKMGPDSCLCRSYQPKEPPSPEREPLLSGKTFVPDVLKPDDKIYAVPGEVKVSVSECTAKQDSNGYQTIVDTCPEPEGGGDEDKEGAGPCCSCSALAPPREGVVSTVWWACMLPASVLLCLTVPDSSNPKLRLLFPLTFLMSVAWLGVLSYLAVWMVTIIGYTLSIPDSVSGLTILAVGASVPDLISSVLVAKSGQGNMAISNLVGSNNFDISVCLGVPWLAKTLLSPDGQLRIQSSALSLATVTLLVTLLIFFMIFQLSGWKLSRGVGATCLLVYALFILFACLFQFNVFGDINLPTCYP